MAKIHIGTSGFYYDHWQGIFYPPGLKKEEWLSFYAQKFNTVEINSSFYRTPRLKTVENWKSKVPDGFIFSFKMSRFITHRKNLKVDQKSLHIFFAPLAPFAGKRSKQLILIQISPNLKKNVERLESFLSLLSKDFLYAAEFRHPSWFDDEVYDILRKHNVALVLSDNPKLWPYVNIDTANFFYIRFHGSKRLFSSSYTDDELKHYAQLIKDKQKKDLDVYAYFNNDAEGYAVKNAKRLLELI